MDVIHVKTMDMAVCKKIIFMRLPIMFIGGLKMRILDDREMDAAWRFLNKNFKFNPSVNSSMAPFQINQPHKVFELLAYWNEAQEKIVNGIFRSFGCRDILALDWEHDCFLFNPFEEIQYGLT